MEYLTTIKDAQAYEIRQGYLSGHSRIRRFTRLGNPQSQYLFTYKKKVQQAIVEIETEISTRDYDKLWSQVKQVVYKTRVKVPDGEYIWEVDFFKNHRNEFIYLVMAEVELPEDLVEPKTIPEFISKYLIYIVPHNDPRFKNKNLSSQKKVTFILDEVLANKENQ